MNSFPYNLYIGEHMDEPLIIKYECSDEIIRFEGCLVGVIDDAIFIKTDKFDDFFYIKLCKPYLKPVEDLTDEELLFVFCSDNRGLGWSIDKIEGEEIILEYTYERWNSFSILDFVFDHCDQELLNRLYSLHSHPKAKQLIEQGLALSYKDLL